MTMFNLARFVFGSVVGFTGVLGLARTASEFGHSMIGGNAYNISVRTHMLPVLIDALLILIFVVWVKYLKDKS